jgi:hypothetical protein
MDLVPGSWTPLTDVVLAVGLDVALAVGAEEPELTSRFVSALNAAEGAGVLSLGWRPTAWNVPIVRANDWPAALDFLRARLAERALRE